MSPLRLTLALALVLLAVVPVATAARPHHARATLQVGDSRYGHLLVDRSGRALYLFTRERTARSACYGACARAWPPYLAHGRLRAGRGLRRSLLRTTRRRDGGRQVTYAGHPLYYYVGDRDAGQVLCQNVREFGGDWLVVHPDGTANRSAR
jgi:predicted lipoprotein with Yx(FWY)xxD motif